MTNQPNSSVHFLGREYPWKGVLEHYWSYMLGYIIPILAYVLILKREPRIHVIMNSYGPVMDRVGSDYMKWLGLNYSQTTAPEEQAKTLLSEILNKIKRQAYRRLHGMSIDENPRFVKRGDALLVPRWDVFMHRRDFFPPKSLELIHQLKPVLLEKCNGTSCCEFEKHKDAYLILDRSNTMTFYENKAKIAGYGKSRRTIKNTKETAATLGKRGLKVACYEPGKHNQACQIGSFANAKGLIGIRGSDFLNMIWMRPGSMIMVYDSSDLDYAPPQKNMATIFNLDYHELSNDTSVLTLDPNDIERTIAKHESNHHSQSQRH